MSPTKHVSVTNSSGEEVRSVARLLSDLMSSVSRLMSEAKLAGADGGVGELSVLALISCCTSPMMS